MGGVSDDQAWQNYWKIIVARPSRRYQVPKGKVGREFTSNLLKIILQIINRKANSEKLLSFQGLILQRHPLISKSKEIKRRIGVRIEAWSKGEYEWLASTFIDDSDSLVNSRVKKLDKDKTASIFNKMVLAGKVKAAIRWLTERDQAGLIDFDESLPSSNLTAKEVLIDKHPIPLSIREKDLPRFKSVPPQGQVTIGADVIEWTAHRIRGSGGPGGCDAESLRRCLLNYGKESRALQEGVSKFTEWLSNCRVEWAAIRGLMAGRLIALKKGSGIRPVGVGEIWRRIMAKALIKVTGHEATTACGVDQLCSGLSCGIEGGIAAAKELWRSQSDDEDWGYLTIDAKNAFNELSRVQMLWSVRHLWPSASRYIYNCYKGWAQLVLRGGREKELTLIPSREGVTQGDPMSMICFGITTIPIIKEVDSRCSFRCMGKRVWYADDAGIGGKIGDIIEYYRSLVKTGEKYGFTPQPHKSELICRNVHAVRLTLSESNEEFSFQVKEGSRYLGSFMGGVELAREYVRSKMESWIKGTIILSEVAFRQPQSVYSAFVTSYQQEFFFLQRVLEMPHDWTDELDSEINETLIPSLFGGLGPSRSLTSLKVRNGGLGIPILSKSSSRQRKVSKEMTSHVTEGILGLVPFELIQHESQVREVRRRDREESLIDERIIFDSVIPQLDEREQRIVKRASLNGGWLSLMPSENNGTTLSRLEFQDGIRLRYGLKPLLLPPKCDGCSGSFTLEHALNCRKGGLIIRRHDDLKEELGFLAGLATNPSAIRDEPLINLCPYNCDGEGSPANQSNRDNRERGDLLIPSLWRRGFDCIVDVQMNNLDATSYKDSDPMKVLENGERIKKNKHLPGCIEQRRDFTPFIMSLDGIIGKEGDRLSKQLAALLSKKWQKPYSRTCHYVRARLKIAAIRGAVKCLRGSRVPSKVMSYRRQKWKDGSGLGPEWDGFSGG